MAYSIQTGVKYDRYNSRRPYDIGDFNERMELIRKSQKSNAKGFAVETEETLRKCWCMVSDLTGKENNVFNAQNNNEKRKFVFRGTKDVKLKPEIKDIIKWDNKFYNVLNISKIQKGQYFEIIAEVNEQCQ